MQTVLAVTIRARPSFWYWADCGKRRHLDYEKLSVGRCFWDKVINFIIWCSSQFLIEKKLQLKICAKVRSVSNHFGIMKYSMSMKNSNITHWWFSLDTSSAETPKWKETKTRRPAYRILWKAIQILPSGSSWLILLLALYYGTWIWTFSLFVFPKLTLVILCSSEI